MHGSYYTMHTYILYIVSEIKEIDITGRIDQ